jgi:metallo-beta-lactamase family protein
MFLEFHGAADEVTGSLHRVHVNGADVLLDCGLFQGHRADSNRKNRELPAWAVKAHALVLSHAHLDHSGNLPSLVKHGFSGNIYATPATRDLCSVMLRDAAMLQEQDARYMNKRHRRDGSAEHVEPLYTVNDVHRTMAQFISLPLHRSMPLAPGVRLTFFNSGHVLGSALVLLELEERGRSVRLLFTGDLGREELPLLDAPEVVRDVDVMITESTYGDRDHGDVASLDERLAEIVDATIGRGGRVFIPTFALERAQEVLYALDRLHERKRLPRVPIYIDSPLAIAITAIYRLHPEGLAPEVRARLLDHRDPFAPPGLHYVSEVSDSIRLQGSGEPCIVIAGSGMCEGGRILHHFGKGLGDARNSVVIVGFMAQHTLGRRLVEGRRKVKVFGLERDVSAQVHVLDGLSAHAGRSDLLSFAHAVQRAGSLRRVAMVHGEDAARKSLGAGLRELGIPEIIDAEKGLRVEL